MPFTPSEQNYAREIYKQLGSGPTSGPFPPSLINYLRGIYEILASRTWTDCVLASGWTGTLQARLNIKRIEFLGKVTHTTPLTTSVTLVATLPASVSGPSSDREVMAPGGTSLNPMCSVGVIVGANGQINAAAFNSNDNPTIVWFDGVSVPV